MGHVLVTGASGFVGRALVAALSGQGRAVTAADRRPAPGDAPSGIRRAIVGEIDGATAWDEALRDAESVVHLAAHVHVAPERAAAEEARFDAVNRAGSARLFDAAAAAGVRRFVFVSSVNAVLSATRPGEPLRDDTEPAPETAYGRSKLAAERALAERAQRTGTGLAILRPPLVCGPGVTGNLGSLIRLAALPVPLPLGFEGNRRTLVSLDTLVGAILAALDAPGPPDPRPYGIGDATPLSTAAIVRALRAGLGRPPRLLPVPALLAGPARRWPVGRRLFGDLEVDSSRFRADYGWRDRVDTRDALAEAAAAA